MAKGKHKKSMKKKNEKTPTEVELNLLKRAGFSNCFVDIPVRSLTDAYENDKKAQALVRLKDDRQRRLNARQQSLSIKQMDVNVIGPSLSKEATSMARTKLVQMLPSNSSSPAFSSVKKGIKYIGYRHSSELFFKSTSMRSPVKCYVCRQSLAENLMDALPSSSLYCSLYCIQKEAEFVANFISPYARVKVMSFKGSCLAKYDEPRIEALESFLVQCPNYVPMKKTEETHEVIGKIASRRTDEIWPMENSSGSLMNALNNSEDKPVDRDYGANNNQQLVETGKKSSNQPNKTISNKNRSLNETTQNLVSAQALNVHSKFERIWTGLFFWDEVYKFSCALVGDKCLAKFCCKIGPVIKATDIIGSQCASDRLFALHCSHQDRLIDVLQLEGYNQGDQKDGATTYQECIEVVRKDREWGVLDFADHVNIAEGYIFSVSLGENLPDVFYQIGNNIAFETFEKYCGLVLVLIKKEELIDAS